jgi:hypothetical protein
MMSQQTPTMPQASPQEFQYGMQVPPMPQPQAAYEYEYNEQYMEALAQRLAPRLTVMLKNLSPMPTAGQRLALAIVSLALLIPLVSIVLGSAPVMATGILGWLIAVGLICVTIMVVNIVFNGGIFTRR